MDWTRPLRQLDNALQRGLHRLFEWRLGVQTSGLEYPDESSVGGRNFYQASSGWIAQQEVLQRIGAGPDDVFVDIGSGKGQAVLVAARQPLKRVIGVELAPELTQKARRNVKRARPKLGCKEVELVTVDAEEWEIPEDLSIVYLYNPFNGELFSRVLERIFAAYDANPRPLRILYFYPWEHNRLLATGRVAVIDVACTRWPTRPGWWHNGDVIVTYEVIAADHSDPPPPLPRRAFRRSQALAYWSQPNDTRFRLERPGEPPVVSGSHN